MGTSDILVEIPDQQLPKLEILYKEKAYWAPHIIGLIENGIRWKKSENYKRVIKFYSPNNSWEEDGTIIVTIQLSRQDIFVFTLDETCSNLYKALSDTNLIKYDKRTQFFAVHEKHVPTVRKYLQDKQIKIDLEEPGYFYGIPPEEARQFVVECPDDVYVKALDPSLAKQINEAWPHRYENSEKLLASYIEINGWFGIFLKSTDEMVAWVIKHVFGQAAMLHTAPGHRGKGYASLVLKNLSKEVAKNGYWALGTIVVDNTVSIKMFEKLGFRCIGTCSFLTKAEKI